MTGPPLHGSGQSAHGFPGGAEGYPPAHELWVSGFALLSQGVTHEVRQMDMFFPSSLPCVAEFMFIDFSLARPLSVKEFGV